MNQAFRQQVLNLVGQIPSGRVMTYGQLALLAGHPGAARQAGYVLASLAGTDTPLPWQRVVNAQGRLSTSKVGLGELQRALLEAEGVQFSESGRLDLRALQWCPDEEAGEGLGKETSEEPNKEAGETLAKEPQ